MNLIPRSTSKTARRVVAGVGLLRIGVGVLLMAQPRLAGSGTTAYITMTRTVGVRDFACGLGYVDAARRGGRGDITRWLWVGIITDVADVVVAIGAAPTTGASATAFAASVPIPVIVTGIALLRHLRRSPAPQLVPDQAGPASKELKAEGGPGDFVEEPRVRQRLRDRVARERTR